jgi:hypothetical protein
MCDLKLRKDARMDEALVIMQVGKEGSPERKRADEVYKFILEPVLRGSNLKPYRSDLDPTPGPISPQILRKLIKSRLVVADLTGRNPNVYYELGIVHSFVCPLICLADSPQSLPFYTKDERIIEIGEYNNKLAAEQAEEGRRKLQEALDVVLAAGYQPASPIPKVAAIQTLDDLAPDDPMAAQIAAIKNIVDEIYEDLGAIRAEMRPMNWRRSAYSTSRGAVEVAILDDKVAVRNGTGAILTFGHDEWGDFLGEIQAGKFRPPQ